jgi:hypothetical protein
MARLLSYTARSYNLEKMAILHIDQPYNATELHTIMTGGLVAPTNSNH